MKNPGFTLIELLVGMAIVGVISGIAFTSARGIFTAQDARSVVTSIRQLFAQGATAAASRGVQLVMVRNGNTITIRTTDTVPVVIRTITLPPSVSTTLLSGTSFTFSAPGKVSFPSGSNPSNQFTISAGGKTYTLEVSVIGEVKVTP